MLPTSPSQTAIFWDFENCRPSSNLSGNKVVYNIRRLVQGYGSITTFRAYIDLSVDCSYSRSISFHSDLQSSGLSLVHCPHNGKKDVADKMMIVDMLAFAIDRPAPACIVLITGDRDFAYAAATLKLRGYHIIVISPASNAHTSLKVQADELYDWQTDVLDPMDFAADPDGHRSETLVTSPPKPSGPPISTTSSSLVCSIHDYPTATSRIGSLRNEVHSITRPQSESNSFLSSLRDPPRPSSSFNSHIDSSPSLNNQYGREAEMGFGLHSAETSTCHGDAMTLDELSCSVDTRAALGRAAKTSIAFEPTRESHPLFRHSSRLLESSETSTEFETASLISEIEPDVPISELSVVARPTSAHEGTSSGNTLHGYTISSAPDSTHIRLETPQDASTGCMEPRQVEQEDITNDSTGSSCQLSNHALVDDRRYRSSITSLPKESSRMTLPSADQPCIGFELAVKAGQTSSSGNLSVPSATSMQSAPLPTREDQQRFQTLISFFIERGVANRPTRILSSEVAVEIRKRNPRVFEIAGVTKLKPYIEAARKVGVIVSPGLDSEGSGWVEINPVLYPRAQEDTYSMKSASFPATPSKKSSSSQPLRPATEWVYAPLTSRLRAETPSHRLLYSALGMFLRAHHPDLYKRANVSGLSAYLEKAERLGVIRIGSGNSPGSEWAELMPAYRGIIHHGSNS
ncbi:hypothetical protein ACEPAH_4794 [Sanghuangporus vaninii]